MSVGVVGPFACLGAITSSVYHRTLSLWAVPVLAGNISNQEEMYNFPPLQLESYPHICRLHTCVSAKDGSEMRL